MVGHWQFGFCGPGEQDGAEYASPRMKGRINVIEGRMADKIALIVAVEHYSDARIQPVQYAEADAKSFESAVGSHGYKTQTMLLSSKATKSSMESNLRRGLSRLRADDEFMFYYAGHGFSKSGHNYITCFDTDPDDLEGTSVSLQLLFDLVHKCASERIAIFLDSCESGITKIAKGRAMYTTMSEGELDAFFREAEYRVCFSACKTSESSYSSGALKHGIWTYHLIEALNGDAPKALEKGHRLTAMSLQNHLSTEVPRTLRKVFSDPKVQTPWKYGGESRDFQIADLTEILQKRAEVKPGYEQLKRVFLREVDSVHISSLSGFVKRRHHVPDYVSSSTQSFVESIAAKEIDERLDKVFEAIKKHLKYKRRDILSEAGRIVTPDFEYAVFCAQDEEDPGNALITEELMNISPSVIESDEFNRVFDKRFSNVVFEFRKKIDVSKLIGDIEDLDRDDITVDYDKSGSWCEVSFDGSEFTVRLEAGVMTFESPHMDSPRGLLKGFFEVQKLLAGTPVALALKA